jgi:hypothetical protein
MSEQTQELLALTSGVQSEIMKKEDVDNILKSPFLPRLQVCGSQTELVKEGRITMATWALVYDKNRFTDAGKEIDFLALAFRPKALRIPKDGGNPMSYFNRESAEFKRVQSDSKVQNSGCMYGLEFLVWMPNQQEFTTLYLGTQSSRRESPALLSEMQKNLDGTPRSDYGPNKVNGKIKLVKNVKGSWHVPQFFPCTSDLATLPDPTELQEELEKFKTPPESAQEAAPAEEARAR